MANSSLSWNHTLATELTNHTSAAISTLLADAWNTSAMSNEDEATDNPISSESASNQSPLSSSATATATVAGHTSPAVIASSSSSLSSSSTNGSSSNVITTLLPRLTTSLTNVSTITEASPLAFNPNKNNDEYRGSVGDKPIGLPPGSLMRGETSEELAPLGLLVIILIVVIGNILVLLAVKLEKRLHHMTFYFFVSMATAHIIMAASAMPPAILVVLAGKFIYQEEVCKLWVTLDLFLCNNTCLHLAFCSMDTYLRLKDPIRHGRPTTTCSLLLWLGAPWVISSVQAIAQFMLSQADHGIIHHGVCFIPDKNFLILGTLFSFLIPAVIAVVFYVLSFHEIQGLRRGKYLEESEASTHNMYGHYGSHESLNDDEDDISDTTSCVSDNLEHQQHQVQTQVREQVQLAVVTTMKDTNNVNPNIRGLEESTSFCDDHEEEEEVKVNGNGNVHNGGVGGQNNLAFADHLLSTDQSSSCTLLLREGGAPAHVDDELSIEREHDCHDESLRYEIIINRLMFMLLLFCITLWIPFSVSNIVYGVCDACRKNMTFPEMLTFKWLAYSSAMVGPFVYAKYSDAIREAYWSIISCKYCRSL